MHQVDVQIAESLWIKRIDPASQDRSMALSESVEKRKTGIATSRLLTTRTWPSSFNNCRQNTLTHAIRVLDGRTYLMWVLRLVPTAHSRERRRVVDSLAGQGRLSTEPSGVPTSESCHVNGQPTIELLPLHHSYHVTTISLARRGHLRLITMHTSDY